tara:strand:- start:1458 stop:1874 length:417 start_codon:yes stop_codon:yes gene_type:complete
MAENKTQPTDASVDVFLDAVDHPVRRADGKALCETMRRLSGHDPVMWGPSIIGFGSYHYRYDSGREGDFLRIGFSPRKANLALYLFLGPEKDEILSRLGKHKRGGGCLYISKLADVDGAVLEELIGASLAHMDATYPD